MSESESFLAAWNKSMRITIPYLIRERLGLEIGDRLKVSVERVAPSVEKVEG